MLLIACTDHTLWPRGKNVGCKLFSASQLPTKQNSAVACMNGFVRLSLPQLETSLPVTPACARADFNFYFHKKGHFTLNLCSFFQFSVPHLSKTVPCLIVNWDNVDDPGLQSSKRRDVQNIFRISKLSTGNWCQTHGLHADQLFKKTRHQNCSGACGDLALCTLRLLIVQCKSSSQCAAVSS